MPYHALGDKKPRRRWPFKKIYKNTSLSIRKKYLDLCKTSKALAQCAKLRKRKQQESHTLGLIVVLAFLASKLVF